MIPQISHFSAKARPTDMVFKVINKRIIKKTKKNVILMKGLWVVKYSF